jgi:hypothetical protein
MTRHLSRRGFVKSSLIATAALPLALKSQGAEEKDEATVAVANAAGASAAMPMSKIGGQDFSRLMMGGNLISGYAHARDLSYVSNLMRRYNTPAKVRQTLELGESAGINAINTWVQDDNSPIFDHWKNGGKMKWFAQARLDSGGGFSQVQKAIDQGAVGVHLTGDTCENLLKDGFEKVAESIDYIRARKRIAGVAAHDLAVIVECEKRKIDVDFYQKTLHSHEYYTAPKQGDSNAVGPNDNSWCSDPEAVVEVFSRIEKPWIAFKILAAGAIHPRTAFPYAVTKGADFILVGMFDWQVEDDAKLARRVFTLLSSPTSKRARSWCCS